MEGVVYGCKIFWTRDRIKIALFSCCSGPVGQGKQKWISLRTGTTPVECLVTRMIGTNYVCT
jgi:hypothetical protein